MDISVVWSVVRVSIHFTAISVKLWAIHSIVWIPVVRAIPFKAVLHSIVRVSVELRVPVFVVSIMHSIVLHAVILHSVVISINRISVVWAISLLTIQRSTVLHSIVLHPVILHPIILHPIILHSVVLHHPSILHPIIIDQALICSIIFRVISFFRANFTSDHFPDFAHRSN